MGKQRTFKVGEEVYDVPEDKAEGFLSRKKDAIEVSSFIVDKDTFDVPLDKVEGFLSRKPNAKPLGESVEPTQSQEIPSITLDSTEVANGTAEAPEWTGDAGTPPTLTKQTKDVFVKHLLELPDNVKSSDTGGRVFVNTFAKKLNISPKDLKQIYKETIQTENELKQLKEKYDQNPDDTDNLYKLAELHNAIGQHDLALEAYQALEGKLRKVGEAEALDPNNPNQRPDYVEQRVMPAIAGMAYTEGLRGNMAEAQRLQALTGYQGQEFSSVGDGEPMQAGNDMVYNRAGELVPMNSTQPRVEYQSDVADALEYLTGFKQLNEMTGHGLEKVKEGMEERALQNYSPQSVGKNISSLIKIASGVVETALGGAMLSSPGAAAAGTALVMAPPEVTEYMMPLSKALRSHYEEQGKPVPEVFENSVGMLDLLLLGLVTHGVGKAKGKFDLKRDWKKAVDEMDVPKLAEAVEQRWEASGKDPEAFKQAVVMEAENIKSAAEDMQVDMEASKVEPYNPPPHPESLRTVEEGASIVMNGEEGILERGDDGTWYHTTDNKSTQIKVEDKFNPTETLNELGIEVLAEITPEQVARATADAEQVGRVEMNGKEYFVSLDRVGNENPTGDFVLEVKPDGTMINRFDSHPDPTFAKERKQKVINTFLESKGLPPRKLTAKVEAKPIEEVVVEAPVEEAVVETPPVVEPTTPQEILPANEPVSPAVEVSKVEPVKATPPKPKTETPSQVRLRKKNELLEDLDKYNSIPKKERGEATNLSNEIQAKAKEQGFSVSYSKKGDLIIMNEKGQRMKKSHVKLTPEQKVEVENRKKEWTKAMGNPVDLRQLVLQYLINRGSIHWDNLSTFVGFKSAKDYPAFVGSDKGARIDDLWDSWRSDRDLSGLIPEDSHVFGNEVGKVISEFGTREQMHEALREYGKGDNWREMGFDSEHQYESALNANKLMQELGVESIEDVHLYEAMEDVANMTDMEVEQALKDLDSNFPKTEQEIQKWYEEHGIETEVNPRTEVSNNERIKAETPKGEVSKAPGEGELTPDTKPVDTPVKITSKEKALKAVDDLEAFLMDLPGVKDNTGAERMGAPFKMEDAVKFFTKTLRESIEQGYKVKDAIERAIGKSKEKYAEMFSRVSEDDLRTRARKNYEDQGIALDKPVEQQFGASHASVAEVRKVMGLEDEVNISEYQKRDVKTVMSEGKKLAENTDVQELATEVNNLTRTLSAEEQAALVYEETRLYNESVKIEDDIMKLNNKGAFNESDQAMITLADVRRKQINVLNALDKAGSEMGLAFRMRQLMNKRDYSVVNLERRWTKATGVSEVPKAIRKEFEQKVKELEQENKKLEELNKAKEKQIADMALADLQEAVGRSKKTPQERIKAAKKARKEELAQKFRGIFNDVSNVIAAMADKEFYEYAKLVFEEAVGDFKEFSKRMVGDLGKNVEPHLQEIFDRASKKEYEKAYIDDKGIHIDNDLLLDIVEAGVKDSKDFLDKVEEAVKVDLPDVSRRQIADAVSGYGKQRNSTLPELVKELNSYKRDLKLESGLSDAQAKLGVKKSGASPPKPTDYQRGLQRQIREFLKDYPQDQAELTKKWATALDKTKSRLKNAITDNTKRIEDIKNGTAVPKTPKDKLKLDAEAEMLKEVNDDLKKQIEDLEGKKTLTDQQRVELAIAAAERTASKYEARTREIRATGTYTKDAPRTLSSPELDIARADRDAKREEYDQVLKDFKLDELEQASRELSASEKRVEALENKIKSNDISFAAKARNRLDYRNNPELAASLYKEKVLKDAIKTMREEQGLVEAREREMWHKRKERQIKDIQHRINTKDFAKKVPKEKVLDMEMEQVQRRLDRIKFDLDVKIEMERYKSIDGWEKFKENITDIVNIPKSMMASMDLSAPLRQGAILFARHPILGMKASKEMIKHLWSEREANAWHETLTSTDGYIRAKNAGLFISEPMAKLVAAEERFSSHLAEKIPLIGRGVKASNRAYSGFLNKMRVDVFNQHYDALVQERFTGKQLQNELNSMAHLINNFTGRGKLGKRGELASPLLNAAFFAPRFVTSRVNNLANALTGYYGEGRWWGKQKMTPRARIEAYKALSAYIGTGLAVLEMAKASGASVEADPRSSDFGKIKIGDLRYDIWAGHQQLVVLLSRIWSQASKDVRTGTVKPFDARSNTKTVAENFIRSKSSPQVGFIWSAMTGKTMGQEEFDAGKEVMRMSIPLLLQDPVIKLIYDDAVSMYSEGGAGLGTVVASGTGVGVNYIPPNPIMKDSNLDPSSEKLMLAKKYQPEKANDDEVYVDGEPYKISEADMEKIKALRAQKAGEKINEEYSTLQDLTDEEYASKVNSYYNEALKEARNEVLPDGWKNEK